MSKPFYEKFGLGGGIECTGTEVMPPLTYNKNLQKKQQISLTHKCSFSCLSNRTKESPEHLRL